MNKVCELCGNVGENRLVKREWLHRVKQGTCGKDRHINLLLKYLVTKSVDKNYEIILFVHLLGPEILSAFGRNFSLTWVI